eukprot:TRINITY_DN63453_c0_g1_i1.p1 TRINITY_DN63453_c0_g1~~TRINITY_DN63453_c0_g1_i1.p1  ORF type:complete len:335 (+),score=78.81 TRINITY_DN63453_c0_g1_i1:89-1093(+)
MTTPWNWRQMEALRLSTLLLGVALIAAPGASAFALAAFPKSGAVPETAAADVVAQADVLEQLQKRRQQLSLASGSVGRRGGRSSEAKVAAWPTDAGFRGPELQTGTSFRGPSSPPLRPPTWEVDTAARSKRGGNAHGGGAPFSWEQQRQRQDPTNVDKAADAIHVLNVANLNGKPGAGSIQSIEGAQALPGKMPVAAATRGQDINSSAQAVLDASAASVYSNLTLPRPQDLGEARPVLQEVALDPDLAFAVNAGMEATASAFEKETAAVASAAASASASSEAGASAEQSAPPSANVDGTTQMPQREDQLPQPSSGPEMGAAVSNNEVLTTGMPA